MLLIYVCFKEIQLVKSELYFFTHVQVHVLLLPIQ